MTEKPETEVSIFEKADRLFQNRSYSEAISLLQVINKNDADYFDAQHLLSRALANLGRYNEASGSRVKLT
ncbi:tetratricopeptide repeat protein, partial [Solemya velesiana gill symbiont]|uniref:tetratricopeptide repeat protein n=1 Tax=Solemya velesiana gill symbiont TaxID=1918948 RepID=UPI001C12A769